MNIRSALDCASIEVTGNVETEKEYTIFDEICEYFETCSENPIKIRALGNILLKTADLLEK